MSEYDDIYDQIISNNEHRNQLENAVRSANYGSIAEILWKVASELLGENIYELKKRPRLRWIITELVPPVCHFIWSVLSS